MFMEGGPSQMDLFDPKPELQKWNGKPLPRVDDQGPAARVHQAERGRAGQPAHVHSRTARAASSSPTTSRTSARCADDLCLVRSMYTDAFNHHPGQLLLFGGSIQVGRPTMGAWVLYGLGSESQNLPGFVVLSSGVGTSGGTSNWSSGFLPSTYQGVVFRSSGDPVLYLSNPPGVTRDMQRAGLDALKDLNQEHYAQDRRHGDRVAHLVVRAGVPDADGGAGAARFLEGVAGDAGDVRRQRGADASSSRTNCLLARRMVERGVRFVMLTHASWDDHTDLNRKLKKNCDIADQPTAALIKDLKQRGLLDDTLVVWGGEFGRTPMVEIRDPRDANNAGRDHHPLAYSMFLAGGGIKGGQVIGKTDELCMNIVEDKVHVHDLQATLLHCLGLEHTRLTYHHMGRDFRLTDVAGNVVQKMLA